VQLDDAVAGFGAIVGGDGDVLGHRPDIIRRTRECETACLNQTSSVLV
jgi:hypothetical protein